MSFPCPSLRACSRRRGFATALGVIGVIGVIGAAQTVAAQDVVGNSTLFDTLAVQRLQHEFSPELSPSVLEFDAKTKTATLTITNHSDSAMKLDLVLEFYRVRTDTAGNITETGNTLAPNDAPSITDWIHGLPAHLTLAPRGTQTVTLTAAIPDSAAANEYWGRVNVTAPSMLRQISAVVRQISTVPGKNELLLQQQPVNANITFTMNAMAKLVYHKSAPAATLTFGKATATVLPGGQVRACVPMHHTGATSLFGTAQMMVKTPGGRDTLNVTFPIEVQDDITPCFNSNLFGALAGMYQVSVSVEPGIGKTHTRSGPSFSAVHVTLPFELKAPIARVAGAHPAATPAPADGVPYVELALENGTLQEQLKREVATAAKAGKRVLVEVGAPWCGPCQAFLHSLNDSIMVDALKDVHVVRLDFNQWGQAFVNGPFPTPAGLPTFFLVKDDGTEGALFDTNTWQPLAAQYGTLDAHVMGPPLKTFLANTKGAGK